MNFIEMTREPLNLNEIYAKVVSPSCGAVSTFVGTTRDHFEDKRVLRLEYDAYIPMAKKKLLSICEQIRTNWPQVQNIALIHRLGPVAIGEASVIVAVSSEHRRASLSATDFGIDQIKSSVPIWKKEIYESGLDLWKQNAECQWPPRDD